jgi:hypothetical protein
VHSFSCAGMGRTGTRSGGKGSRSVVVGTEGWRPHILTQTILRHNFDALIICCLHLMSWTTVEKEALLFIGSNGSGRILTDVGRNQLEVRFLREICGMSGQERVKPRRFGVAPICGGN